MFQPGRFLWAGFSMRAPTPPSNRRATYTGEDNLEILMDTNQPQQLPEQGTRDTLGRELSTVIGYTQSTEVPLGSLVTLLPAQFRRHTFDCHQWKQGIVVGRVKDRDSWRDEYRLLVRKLTDLSDWEPWTNTMGWPEVFARVDTAGNGEPPVAGTDYPLCKKEIFDARWRSMDHRHQDWSNPPTFLAHLQLRTDQRHYRAVLGMVRKDEKINPSRLETYWFRHCETKMPDWAKYPEGFPESLEYLYRINWAEVAQEFEDLAKELRSFVSNRLGSPATACATC